MEMENKAIVKINGNKYTITGDKSEEEMLRIAQYVDNKMSIISRLSRDSSAVIIAMLTAVNIAEDYFEALNQMERLRTEKSQLEKDSAFYLKMVEDSKKNSEKYEDDIANMAEQKKEYDESMREMKNKCAEYENSFFDLQREKLELKNELARLKKQNKGSI